MCKKIVFTYKIGLVKRFSYDLLCNFLVFDVKKICLCEKEEFDEYGDFEVE